MIQILFCDGQWFLGDDTDTNNSVFLLETWAEGSESFPRLLQTNMCYGPNFLLNGRLVIPAEDLLLTTATKLS